MLHNTHQNPWSRSIIRPWQIHIFMILYMLKTTTIFVQLAPKKRKLKRFIRVTWFTTFKQCLQQIFTSTFDNFDKSMSEKVITIWANFVINAAREQLQYAGFEGHTVKHEPLCCIYLSRLLNWVYNFALRALEDANRLITDSNSRMRTRLLSIAMRHKELRRSSDTVVRISFFTGDNTEKDLSPLQIVTGIQR